MYRLLQLQRTTVVDTRKHVNYVRVAFIFTSTYVFLVELISKEKNAIGAFSRT